MKGKRTYITATIAVLAAMPEIVNAVVPLFPPDVAQKSLAFAAAMAGLAAVFAKLAAVEVAAPAPSPESPKEG